MVDVRKTLVLRLIYCLRGDRSDFHPAADLCRKCCSSRAKARTHDVANVMRRSWNSIRFSCGASERNFLLKPDSVEFLFVLHRLQEEEESSSSLQSAPWDSNISTLTALLLLLLHMATSGLSNGFDPILKGNFQNDLCRCSGKLKTSLHLSNELEHSSSYRVRVMEGLGSGHNNSRTTASAVCGETSESRCSCCHSCIWLLDESRKTHSWILQSFCPSSRVTCSRWCWQQTNARINE